MLDKEWKYLARDEDRDYIFIYKDCPTRETGYWAGGYCMSLEDNLFKDFNFDNIKWEDETPCEFRKYLGEE